MKGKDAYSRLKHESGVHRVQRVPVTESSGRIHTSTATVAVLPEAKDVEVEIRPEDLKIDVFRSAGPGGQSVNTTDSAVRITHRPTGIVVGSQEERSQLQNREKAMRYLRARLLHRAQEEAAAKEAAARRSQVGTGERAEKIRTYNFPENRVTDHRVKLTVHRLPDVLAGDLDAFVEALNAAERRSSSPARTRTTRTRSGDVRPAEVLLRATDYLDRHGVESPKATAEILLMHVLGTDRAACTLVRQVWTRARPGCSAARSASAAPERRCST